MFKLGTGIDHPSGITWLYLVNQILLLLLLLLQGQKVKGQEEDPQRVEHKMVAMATPVA